MMQVNIIKIILLIFLLKIIYASKKEFCNKAHLSNDNIESSLLLNHVPFGHGQDSVKIFRSVDFITNDKCIKDCCLSERCDAVIINEAKCNLIKCKDINDCKPVKLSNVGQDQYYVLIRNLDPEMDNAKETMDEALSSCELNLPDSCLENQYCKEISENRRSGICVCSSGYIKKGDGCVKESRVKKPTTKKPITSKLMTSANVTYLRLSTKKKEIFNNHSKKEISKKHHSSTNTNSEVNIKVLKFPLGDQPEVVSIYGNRELENNPEEHTDLIYSWKRLPESLAVGTVVNNSNSKPVLLLTNLLQGLYVFEVTVSDIDGLIARNTIKLNIVEIEDDTMRNLVNIILTTNVYQFTEKDKDNFSKRMAHVIEKDLFYSQCTVFVHSIAAHYNNNTRITFYAKMFDNSLKEFQIISSGLLEKELKNKITENKFIFDYPVELFQSRICYNDCGGHGVCDQISHRCKCGFPWFNNGYHENKTGFSNCDMHVMIVVASCAVGFFFLVMLFIILKKIVKRCRLRGKYGRKVLQYRLLEDPDP